MAQRYVQTLDLVDDASLIEQYREAHRHVWPEILAGIRQVGITAMDIYLLGNRMTMILELADGVDFDEAMDKLSRLPRQAEWEEYVGRFQICAPGSTSAGKWQRMESIFSLPDAEPDNQI